jgi:hypothetical protein
MATSQLELPWDSPLERREESPELPRVDPFCETREWKMGDGAQKRWAEAQARRGRIVLPVYGFEDNVPETKAPMLIANDGLLVAPDLLLMGGSKGVQWNEVKAKAAPTWRRLAPGPRWEHGCDYSLLIGYEEVQERSAAQVFIVLNETMTPMDLQRESQLVTADIWLYIPLDDAKDFGQHRPDWPGGKQQPKRRGRRGMGGWLWPRDAMKLIPSTCL